jgi:glycosyltransferase involved in cell wall biosynthesis
LTSAGIYSALYRYSNGFWNNSNVSTVDYGIIVEYNDKPEIKNSILRLRDNPDLRSRLGKNARRAFLDKSNWKNVEKELFLLYKDSLN